MSDKTKARQGFKLLLIILLLPAVLSSCEDLLGDLDSGVTREMLEDTWKVDEMGGSYKSDEEIFWVEMYPHPTDTTKVIIYNFFNVDADAEAVLKGRSLIMAQQTLEGGYSVVGNGQIQGNRANEILWSYTVDDGSGDLVNYTAIFTRLTF